MPLEMTALSELLTRAASRWPEKAALSDRARRLSYAELLQIAETVAANLSALGIRPDDRVAVIVDKRIECVAAIFGCYLAEYVIRRI